MNKTERFAQYAEDFEKTYADDDWSRLRQHFTDDAVYETVGDEAFAGRAEGLDALLDRLQSAVNGFDRKFATRNLELKGDLEERPDSVFLSWEATYTVPDAPALTLAGTEEAVFDGDRIKHLKDTFRPEIGAAVAAWMEKHGTKLGS